jgi:hypothetical protein
MQKASNAEDSESCEGKLLHSCCGYFSAFRRTTMKPSEWAEKMASTARPSSSFRPLPDDPLDEPVLLLARTRDDSLPKASATRHHTPSSDQKNSPTHPSALFRPSKHILKLPNTKPPSLGCPESLTPQPLDTSIHCLTFASSRALTKS